MKKSEYPYLIVETGTYRYLDATIYYRYIYGRRYRTIKDLSKALNDLREYYKNTPYTFKPYRKKNFDNSILGYHIDDSRIR